LTKGSVVAYASRRTIASQRARRPPPRHRQPGHEDDAGHQPERERADAPDVATRQQPNDGSTAKGDEQVATENVADDEIVLTAAGRLNRRRD
jgi:hypothetical protein